MFEYFISEHLSVNFLRPSPNAYLDPRTDAVVTVANYMYCILLIMEVWGLLLKKYHPNSSLKFP